MVNSSTEVGVGVGVVLGAVGGVFRLDNLLPVVLGVGVQRGAQQ